MYMISHGDARVAHGESYPYRRWRSYGRDIPSMLNEGKEVKGFDCIILQCKKRLKCVGLYSMRLEMS